MSVRGGAAEPFAVPGAGPLIGGPVKEADPHAAQLLAMVPDLSRYARQLTRSAGDAEDLVQEALERALAKRHQFIAGTSLRAWVFTILRNAFLSDCRARRRRLDREGEIEAAWPAADRSSRDGEALAEVRLAFVRLSARERKVIALAAVGHSYDELATALDVPVGTVRSRLSRARARLHRLTGASPA